MLKSKPVFLLIMTIGALAFAASVYGLIKGDPWSDHLIGLFGGITLMGTAYINRDKDQREA